mmetsp:Transcript_62692/g.104252  ORF Transcript_62692/g.104252 Transcript_62692/m.104252 type:complete len:527 (-) Transcript_62692:192-1772(-)
MSEAPTYDDNTLFLQVQQFLDEWHYRVLHGGLGLTMTRNEALMIAFEIFELNGLETTEESKEAWSTMEDEDDMIRLVVKAMPMPCRKAFEHFTLQLQLVVSTATRARHALEEGIPEEVARCMDDGDTGVSQQILKQCVIDAGMQISELKNLRESWHKNVEERLKRLARCQEEAENAQQQLTALQAQISAFGAQQNAKTKSVLMNMASKEDKTLLHTVFSAWTGWYVKIQGESVIHNKFKKQIEEAENALVNFKAKQLKGARSMLNRNAAGLEKTLLDKCLGAWYRDIITLGHTKDMDDALEAAKNKLANAKGASKDNTMKVMTRMAAGQDKAIITLCLNAWTQALEETKKDRLLDDAVRAQEEQIAEFLKNKSEQAKGVLARVSGGTDTGVMKNCLSAWIELYKQEKQEKEMEQMIHGQNERFKSLNLKQRGNAKSVASKANRMEEENMLMVFFQSWNMDTKMERVIRHYGGKLDQKKHQLDAVQNMFKSFASQLEQGIGSTPRSQRKSKSSRTQDDAGRPPIGPA